MEATHSDPKQWRQRKGISLAAIADTTKLSVRHLEAIETGNFGRLPGGIYATSYIRQYAKAIGIDPAAILARYQAASACDAPEGLPVGAHRLVRQAS